MVNLTKSTQVPWLLGNWGKKMCLSFLGKITIGPRTSASLLGFSTGSRVTGLMHVDNAATFVGCGLYICQAVIIPTTPQNRHHQPISRWGSLRPGTVTQKRKQRGSGHTEPALPATGEFSTKGLILLLSFWVVMWDAGRCPGLVHFFTEKENNINGKSNLQEVLKN